MAKRALVVDDSASMRHMVSTTLTGAGYEVVQAVNGEDGLKQLSKAAFDVIITDLNMPVMDGITFTQQVRATPALKYTPVLLLTTESRVDQKTKARAAGATGWLTKPFDPVALVTTLKKLMP
jgi:two-component system chemotaxis response regulator CheY